MNFIKYLPFLGILAIAITSSVSAYPPQNSLATERELIAAERERLKAIAEQEIARCLQIGENEIICRQYALSRAGLSENIVNLMRRDCEQRILEGTRSHPCRDSAFSADLNFLGIPPSRDPNHN